MKDLSLVFFNSVEEMNECYGIDAELPSKMYGNADLVCYEIVEPFMCEYLAQYKFADSGFYHLSNLGEPVFCECGSVKSESDVHVSDVFEYEGRCFVYVRVNEHLRKRLEKSLLGCEFVHCRNKADIPFRRFVHSVEVRKSGIVVTDQNGYDVNIVDILFYPDNYSSPIPYQEWVKEINKKDVED